MKRNELKEIVDRELSGLTWDESKSRRVLDALDERHAFPVMPVRRKFSLVLALAILLTLLATTALAVALIRYAPRVNAETQARQLLMAEYGLTRETLGLFTSEVTEEGGETVVTFTPALWEDEFTGVYTVRFQDGKATASWTYDDIDPALWQDGDFAAPVWGPAQLAAYLAQDAENKPSLPYEQAHIRDNDDRLAMVDALPTPDPDVDAAFWDGQQWIALTWDSEREMWIYDGDWSEGNLTLDEAMSISRAALRELYDLTESQAAEIDFFNAILAPQDGARIWDLHAFLYLDGVDLNLYAEIDAQSGEVLRIGLETGGNG